MVGALKVISRKEQVDVVAHKFLENSENMKILTLIISTSITVNYVLFEMLLRVKKPCI